MPSNTSKGRGRKGSKFWMQTLVNLDNGSTLSKAIQSVDNSIDGIKWLSPLKNDSYGELKTKQIPGLEKADFSFWPDNGPWWDGVGIDDKGCILLVEAKGHVAETKTKCAASSKISREKICKSMQEVHDGLTNSHNYDEEAWLNKYYQLGNRLTFLVKLRDQGYNVKLVLLNIVDDPTHIATSLDAWKKHYNDVFGIMLGTAKYPNNVVMVNLDVG
jgi:hypothetical protein